MELPKLFKTAVGRVGNLICFDVSNPTLQSSPKDAKLTFPSCDFQKWDSHCTDKELKSSPTVPPLRFQLGRRIGRFYSAQERSRRKPT